MRQKYLRMLIYFCFLIFLLLCTIISCSSEKSPQPGLRWIREDSYFVDYVIDNNLIELHYAFCFENNSQQDILISPISARFDTQQLGDLYQKMMTSSGYHISGEYSTLIPSQSKNHYIFVFTCEYNGENLSDTLLLPEAIVYIQE